MATRENPALASIPSVLSHRLGTAYGKPDLAVTQVIEVSISGDPCQVEVSVKWK
jgi:hypothetical protein